MERIGVAFTKPRGSTNRRREYGVFQSDKLAYGRPVPQKLYARYQGYREDSPTGEVMTGLPLAGPMATHTQPLTPFYESHFEVVRFFEKPASNSPS